MTGLLAEKGKTTSKRDRLLTVDVCADCFSGLGFVQIPIKQKRTRHLTMTGLLAERGGLTSLPSANTNWLSLPLKLFFLKTVHRTVFFTEKPSRVQIPFNYTKKMITTKCSNHFFGGERGINVFAFGKH